MEIAGISGCILPAALAGIGNAADRALRIFQQIERSGHRGAGGLLFLIVDTIGRVGRLIRSKERHRARSVE